MRVLFFGSSSYCLPVLETIHNHFQLVGIISKPSHTRVINTHGDSSFPSHVRPSYEIQTKVENFAKSHNIEVFTPQSETELLKLKEELKNLLPDIAVVADYGLFIPKEIFTLPPFKTINIHFSRLPDLRGPSPVQYTILRGDESAWISVILMSEEMDKGDIIKISNFKCQVSKETTKTLYEKLFVHIAARLPTIIEDFVNGKLSPQKQDHNKATYTRLLRREDGFIPQDLLNLALEGKIPSPEQLSKWPLIKKLSQTFTIDNSKFIIMVERALRAFFPWPGLWTEINLTKDKKQSTKRLKILNGHIGQERENEKQKTKLILDSVQLEGKKPVSFKQFREGYNLFV